MSNMTGRSNAVNNHTFSAGRVRYIEPNNIPVNSIDGPGVNKMVHNPEDYSIFVDLEVRTYDRFYKEETRQNITYNGSETKLHEQTTMGGIMSGSRITTNGYRFLTTNSLNTSFDDIQKGNNTEGLCIESIDISYNAYNFPEVNIKFTDIRGVSLMSPADYYHTSDSVISGTGKEKNRDFFTKSFISTFFRFPYPKYILTVKGFYGKSVSYELCVIDFKTSFNKTTGNFDIYVKFIGYMFGCLTDIPIRALFYAPFDEAVGKGYWEKQTSSDGKFFYDDEKGNKTPMITFIDLSDKIEAGSVCGETHVEEIKQATDELEKTKKEITVRENLKKALEGYYNSFPYTREILIRDKTPTGDGAIVDNNKWQLLVTEGKYSPSPGDKYCSIDKQKCVEVEEAIRRVQSALESYKKETGQYPPREILDFFGKENHEYFKIAQNKNGTIEVFDGFPNNVSAYSINKERGLLYNGLKETVTELVKDLNNSEGNGASFNFHSEEGNSARVWSRKTKNIAELWSILLHKTAFTKTLDDDISKLQTKSETLSKDREEKILESLYNLIGFKPTIKNIMDMVLAHLDTYMYVMYATVDKIEQSERTVGKIIPGEVENTDLPREGGDNTKLPPFFTYSRVIKTDDNIDRREEVWLGSNPKTASLDEVNLINSFLNGVADRTMQTAELKERLKDANTTVEGSDYPSAPPFFSLFYDALTGQNPYDTAHQANRYDENWIDKLFVLFALRVVFANYTLGAGNANMSTFVELEANAAAESGIMEKYELRQYIKDANPADINAKYLVFSDPKKCKDVYKLNNGEDIQAPIRSKGGSKANKLIWNQFPFNPKNADALGNWEKQDREFIIKTSDGKTKLTKNIDNFFEIKDGPAEEVYKNNIKRLGQFYGGVDNMLFEKTSEKWNGYVLKSKKKQVRTHFSDGIRYYSNFNVSKEDTLETIVEGGQQNFSIFEKKICEKCKFSKNEIKTAYVDLVNNRVDLMSLDTRVAPYLNFYALKGKDAAGMGEECCVFLSDFFTKQTTKEAKAFVFLHALPTSTFDNLNTLYVMFCEHFKTSGFIAELPKSIILFLGALLWRYYESVDPIYISNSFEKPAKDCFFKSTYTSSPLITLSLNPKGSVSAKYVKIESDISKNLILTKIDDGVREGLISFFKKWANGQEFERLINEFVNIDIENATTKIDRIKGALKFNNGVYQPPYIKLSTGTTVDSIYALFNPYNQGVESINKLMLNEVTLTVRAPGSFVFNNGPSLSDAIEVKNGYNLIEKFLNTLKDRIVSEDVEKKRALEKIGEANQANATNDAKLSLYQTFKNLYNKWLIPHTHDFFKLDKDSRKNRKTNGYCLANQFVYINTYYERIDNKVNFDPRLVKKIVDECIENVKTNSSLYTFIYDLASTHKVQLLALPVFNDFADPNFFYELFTPIPYEEFAVGNRMIGNTYVFIYPEEASENVGINTGVSDSELLYKYADDSFMLVDVAKMDKHETAPSTFWTNGENNDNVATSEIVNCFGVTFAKDDQSIFKGIDVSMDNPKTTEYSLANTFLVARENSPEANRTVTYNGQNLFTIYSTYSYQASVEMMGCPSIMPLMYFQLNNIPMFRGTYIIINVKHSIRPGSMSTTFVGQRIRKIRTPYAKDVNPNVSSKTDGTDDAMIKSVSVDSLGNPVEYTLDGRAVPSENYYTIVQKEGGVYELPVLYALKRVLSNNEEATFNGKALVLGEYGQSTSLYGIWRNRGSNYSKAGFSSLQEFITDEEKGANEQSRHFASVIKGTAANFLIDHEWGFFYDYYFGLYYTVPEIMTREQFIQEMDAAYQNAKKTEKKKAGNMIILTPAVFDTGHTDIPAFDVSSAVNWLKNNSIYPPPYGRGNCMLYVRLALQAGGYPLKPCGSAAGCIPSFNNAVITIGDRTYNASDLWEDITDKVNVSKSFQNNDIPPINCMPGDIAIFDSGVSHKSGHACMCIGTNEANGETMWASDFIQTNRWHGCKATSCNGLRYYVFRYKNRQSYSRQNSI